MNKLLPRALAGLLALTLCASDVSRRGKPGGIFPPASSAHGARADSRPAGAARGGSLVLVGGGGLPDSIRQRFLELAGGNEARIVVIPSASALPDAPTTAADFWKTAPVKSVRVLYTTRRRQADDPRVYGLLRDATGVWISGGDQSRLADLYDGTAVERELGNVLRRGGVVGGTSAGASVVSAVMMAEGGKAGRGFGLIDDAIVDQHFSNRGRLPRLLGLLGSHPDQVGIGIDQETAVVIRGGEAEVLGDATVTVARVDGPRPSVRVYRAGSHFPEPVITAVSATTPHPLH